MGNSLRKIDLDGLSIDGGAVKSSEPVPQITLANGQRQPDPNAHDAKVVGKLIAKRRLAPFYEGKFDEPKDSASGRVSSRKRSVQSGRSGGLGSLACTPTPVASKSSSKQGSVDKKWLTSSLLECPICLMWYPRNINVTKCCRKNICTQCFVNMKRPRQAQALIACPFCRASNLTAIYKPPDVLMGKTSKYYRSGVTCESIRPTRVILQPQRPMYYRYATAAGAGQTAFAVPTTQNGRTTYTFYQQRQMGTAPNRAPNYPSRYQAVPSAATRMAPPGYQRVTTARAPAPSVNGDFASQQADEALLRRIIALSALEY